MSERYSQKANVARSLFDNWRLTLVLFLAAVLLLMGGLLLTIRVQKISGTEIGIKVNNLNGEIEIIHDSGTHIYNGIMHTFYLLDATVQRLEMTADENRGDRNTEDDLRIKTVDGSDVYLDLTINYTLKRDRIKDLINTSGPGNAYKIKWVRDYSRSVCRSVFGEMTTEEFYDASIRNEKAQSAEEELNKALIPYGIEVVKVVAEKFRFHPEYEQKIRAKKLADQEVEEQISKANAARQNQLFRIVEAEKKKDVQLASYAGEMKQLIVEAKAKAEKEIKEAEAYAIKVKLGADGKYYEMDKNAQAILAKTKAEAEGVKQMALALEGEGGVNIVRMEYAKKLQGIDFRGEPYSIDAHTERFSHTQEAASSIQTKH